MSELQPSPKEGPLLRGALVAPLAAPLATLLLGPLFDEGISFAIAPLVFFVTVPVAYVAVLALGLPLALLLRRFGRLTTPNMVVSTVLLVFFVSLIVGLNSASSTPRSEAWQIAAFSSAVATAVAAVWCVIARIPWRSRQEK